MYAPRNKCVYTLFGAIFLCAAGLIAITTYDIVRFATRDGPNIAGHIDKVVGHSMELPVGLGTYVCPAACCARFQRDQQMTCVLRGDVVGEFSLGAAKIAPDIEFVDFIPMCKPYAGRNYRGWRFMTDVAVCAVGIVSIVALCAWWKYWRRETRDVFLGAGDMEALTSQY